MTVVGVVMSPGSIIWKNKLKVNDYISSVAGFTQLADKDKVFVINPNGKAKDIQYVDRNNSVRPEVQLLYQGNLIASNLDKYHQLSIIYQLTLTCWHSKFT